MLMEEIVSRRPFHLGGSLMTRIRLQFSIARLMAAMLAVALAFTVFPPMVDGLLPAACIFAVGMLIPIFVTDLTGPEAVCIIVIAFVLAALVAPTMYGHGAGRRAAAFAVKAAPVAAAPASAPGPR
jgi:hypothetical protein